MIYIVYILYSKTINRYYVGYTGDDIEERLRKHNTNHKGYTGKTDDWEIMYTESYTSKTEAMQRELKIKKRKSRKYIEELIRSAG